MQVPARLPFQVTSALRLRPWLLLSHSFGYVPNQGAHSMLKSQLAELNEPPRPGVAEKTWGRLGRHSSSLDPADEGEMREGPFQDEAPKW